MPSTVRIVLVALSATAIAGCASVQVRRVGTNTGPPAYDLAGPDLGTLAAEAQRLCPQGHAVMRQWQRSDRLAGQGDASMSWVLTYDLRPDQAQMSIACKG